MSGICAGSTPHLAFTAASSKTTRSPPRPVVENTFTRGLTSCSMSLSEVTSTSSTGRSRVFSTTVPSTSSASKPGTSSTGRRSASNRVFT